MRCITIVSNNDGGHPALIHADLDAAKRWVRAWLTDPENDPPQSAEERAQMERQLGNVEAEYCSAIRGSEAWKEWIYISPLAEDQAPQDQIRFLGDLQRIQRKPGDVFVLKIDGAISMDVHHRLQEIWWRTWNDQEAPIPKLLILDNGMKIGVVGPLVADEKNLAAL